jgi:hypothetical protein
MKVMEKQWRFLRMEKLPLGDRLLGLMVRDLLLGRYFSGRKRRSRRDCHIRQHLFTREQALHFRSFHSLYIAADHPAGTFAFFGLQDAPEVDKPEDWTFFFYISWNSSLEQQDEERKNFGNKE